MPPRIETLREPVERRNRIRQPVRGRSIIVPVDLRGEMVTPLFLLSTPVLGLSTELHYTGHIRAQLELSIAQ